MNEYTPGVQTLTADREESLRLYRQMLLMRRFEETVLELMVRTPLEIEGPVHPYIGEEAIAAGVCAALKLSDKIMSTHRGHGHCIGKGGDPDRMMAELFGRVDGYCKGKGGSMHIADFDIGMLGANGIVAAGIPIATGAALAELLQGSGNVVACMFGDGAAAAGPLHESLNIAAMSRLPIVFVCENNGWSVNTPPERSLVSSVVELAAGYGVEGITVDGNDVLAVRAAALFAVDRARKGLGPTMIEATTFRRTVHATRGPAPADSRDPELLERWIRRDPLDRFHDVLMEAGVMTDAEATALADSVEAQMADAVAFARNSPFPEFSDAFEDVWA